MDSNRLTFTVCKYTGREVMTQACASRNAAQQRAALCDLFGVTPETCWTTGELMRDAVRAGLVSKPSGKDREVGTLADRFALRF